ncbi:hypothetical protein [Paenibacillus sedimenti]|uniref:Uncharacterized protein n=1 Tax=Paenibacillus sedimenti TaxID=2770274 RepID=A0A926KKG9_9BACL|nr:hypothetical protein [Paenibacillus sedimenti]MBD0378753.1 hypothetical protein [Paenibacillus sedimenti]
MHNKTGCRGSRLADSLGSIASLSCFNNDNPSLNKDFDDAKNARMYTKDRSENQ